MENIMSENSSSAVGIFSSHLDAESAVKELQVSGYDMKKLSVVGKDHHLIVHGTAQEVEKAKRILMQNRAEEANVHEVVIG